MKPATIRKRLLGMEQRLQNDMASFERLFPNPDWEGGAYATEVNRNLATAIGYLQMMQGLSDFGINSEVERHALTDGKAKP